MKTVTLPIEDYEKLVQDSQDKQRLIKEIEADASERGYMVRYVSHFWLRPPYESGNEFLTERNTLEIFSKDKVLADAQKEIERLTELATTLADERIALSRRLSAMRCRGFFARMINREDK